ncbi:chorismate synthase [Sulfodiicoccus acidiphilus]|uniref:Chorismate synthase n=1 Tax=Sulfodiicoccus acidiphilus TaxID=1670455 RepID=A0A348B109_9CREN|nr:chorismate synthase [Sulfodiicoccus acidiphilus]BBD71861.1 chorismate synthase [Sulfodiicoccus acidiphilus]GGU02501.1 chorismate synthase [Sulfodiicoccus acidiphilus]
MTGSSFGEAFRITTFGESHGPEVGVVVDGVPAGLPLSEEDVKFELSFRRPGRRFVSGRREEDVPLVVSGLFEGRTTGAPVTIVVKNNDVISSLYSEVRYKPRPGHADLTYVFRYGFENWDYRGGGRASARETVGRVAAGAIAKKLLGLIGVTLAGYLRSLGEIESTGEFSFEEMLCSKYSPVRAADRKVEASYEELLKKAIIEGDSYGGVAEVIARGVPAGLGEPVFDKLKADLAKAVLSIPAVVGFEYGLGFKLARMRGSEANDEIVRKNGRLGWRRNVAGGIIGGISNGEDIVVRAAFKPTSSIRIPQRTVDLRTMEETTISVLGRHDPSVAVRGVAVVESMVALVLVDHAMRSSLIPRVKLTQDQAKVAEEMWRRYIEACRQGLSEESQ